MLNFIKMCYISFFLLLGRVQRWNLAKTIWDECQHLCSTRLHHYVMNDDHHDDNPISLFTSILKDITQETIPKTSAVTKRFNKPRFAYRSVMCNVASDLIITRLIILFGLA